MEFLDTYIENIEGALSRGLQSQEGGLIVQCACDMLHVLYTFKAAWLNELSEDITKAQEARARVEAL